MPKSLTGSLKLLADIGIVKVALPPHQGPVTASSVATSSAGPVELAGSLGPGVPERAPDAPKQQPSLFWKSIGFCVKNKFTSSGSLRDDGRALFLADPGQPGIVAGDGWPREVTNFQLFLAADAMQQLNSPSFSLKGGSYFEFLNLYLKWVQEENKSDERDGARDALLKCKAEKDEMWEKGRVSFIEDQQKNSTQTQQSFADYLKHYPGYLKAWEAEEKAELDFSQSRSPALASLSARLETIRLADMRTELQTGNNMPVIATDDDWLQKLRLNPGLDPKDSFDPKLVYYRPQYTLPQYQATVDSWNKNGPRSDLKRDGPYMIPLANIWDESWSDLGHPLLDKAKPKENLTAEQKDFINQLTATLTFLQDPYMNNISRGVWDMTKLRGTFPLLDNAPKAIQDPICKTSKLYLTWGIEIELTLPEVVSSSTVKNITLAAMNLPLRHVGPDGKKLVFSAGGTSFPVLVGALADVI